MLLKLTLVRSGACSTFSSCYASMSLNMLTSLYLHASCVQQRVCCVTLQHPQAVSAVQFHPTYQHVFVSGCLDNRIRIWDTSKNRVLNFKDTRDPVTTARFSKDGESLVCYGKSLVVMLLCCSATGRFGSAPHCYHILFGYTSE
jgi:WD40 repeat protein